MNIPKYKAIQLLRKTKNVKDISIRRLKWLKGQTVIFQNKINKLNRIIDYLNKLKPFELVSKTQLERKFETVL